MKFETNFDSEIAFSAKQSTAQTTNRYTLLVVCTVLCFAGSLGL